MSVNLTTEVSTTNATTTACVRKVRDYYFSFLLTIASLGALASASAHLFMCSCAFGSLPPSLTVYN